LLVGWDKALPFPAIDATNACNVPYAGLQLFNINIFWVFNLRVFAEESKSFFYLLTGIGTAETVPVNTVSSSAM